jgi:glycosyltransferase involved in cell wall biosynthesis
VYVQATEICGTHPALIEAMGRGALTIYLQTPETGEVAGDAAVPFTDNLVEKLQWAVDTSEEERSAWGRRASERIEKLYSWKVVTDRYEGLLASLITK